VRECPDFAEKGSCPNIKCKLPHVIRASHRRAAAAATKEDASNGAGMAIDSDGLVSDTSSTEQRPPDPTQNNIGDEYISLTFHESGESEEEDGEDEDEGSGEEDQDDDDVDGSLQVVA